MEESESEGRKQEVRFHVIDQAGWHEEMLAIVGGEKVPPESW